MCFTHIVGQGCVVTLSASQRLRRLLQNLVVLFGEQSKQTAQGERHRERKQSEHGDNKINKQRKFCERGKIYGNHTEHANEKGKHCRYLSSCVYSTRLETKRLYAGQKKKKSGAFYFCLEITKIIRKLAGEGLEKFEK